MDKLQSTIKNAWDSAQGSLWLTPAIMVSITFVLSFVLLELDKHYSDYITGNFPWLFSGTPSAARSLLATIAGSVITVISIAFSLTIIAIQQASVQFTPRVLRTFTSDRGNQIVLGAYIATFVYSLLILRAVRSEDGGVSSFVPSISSTVAIFFVLICVGLLIYFINHIASSLQASTIIARVHSELLAQIDSLYPEMIGKELRPGDTHAKRLLRGKEHAVISKETGFVTIIHEDILANVPLKSAKAIRIVPKVGDFVAYGDVVAEVYGEDTVTDKTAKTIRAAIAVNGQRTASEDPLFPIRQLVDTALKGLSPGINDTTTSDYCIRYLGDALSRLGNRKFPSSVRTFDDVSYKLILNKPSWEEFVAGSFDQIIHNAADHVQVLIVLLTTLERLAGQLPNQERAEPVRKLTDTISSLLNSENYLPSDKKRLKEHIISVRKVLDAAPASSNNL